MRCAGRPLAVAAIAAGAEAPQDCTRADSRSQILDLFIPWRGTAAPALDGHFFLAVSLRR
jgi:hypothetical protein